MYVAIAQAPFTKLEAYRTRRDWPWPIYSSYGSDFNYDFGVDHRRRPGARDVQLPRRRGAEGGRYRSGFSTQIRNRWNSQESAASFA